MTPADLRARRVALKLTQAALAVQLGVDVTTVAKWERGEMQIRHERMVEMALTGLEAGEVEVAALFAAGDAANWAASAGAEARRAGVGAAGAKAAAEAYEASRRAQAAYDVAHAAAWRGDVVGAKRALAEVRRAVRDAEAATLRVADMAEAAAVNAALPAGVNDIDE